MTLTPETLDSFARTYYLNDRIEDVDIEEMAQRESISSILETLNAATVHAGGRVLEMGYGTGCITTELLKAGMLVEVVEGSPVLADVARRRHPGLVVHTDLFETFDPEEPYDAVLALHVLEHVDDPVGLAGHIRGWLRPGGVLTAVTPNRESLHRRLAVLMGIQPELDSLSERDRLVGHQRVYGIDTLRHDLGAAGFHVVGEFGYFLKMLPNTMLLDLPTALLAACNRISPEIPPSMLANIGVIARRPV